jgi:2-C-methyl-D-erythritol 2,4-cyclodiphosphate synthase
MILPWPAYCGASMVANLRIGIGHDVHRLAIGRPLILGGVSIPYEKGLEGWSDADALVHSIIDAILGAAGLGDIGQHFPPGNSEYKGISSLRLLGIVKESIGRAGWVVINIDASIIAEEPRLGGFIGQMRQTLGATLGINPGQVNIKAGTNEGMGFAGRGEGIEVLSVALLQKAEENVPDVEEGPT